jgi:hypothetical protein
MGPVGVLVRTALLYHSPGLHRSPARDQRSARSSNGSPMGAVPSPPGPCGSGPRGRRRRAPRIPPRWAARAAAPRWASLTWVGACRTIADSSCAHPGARPEPWSRRGGPGVSQGRSGGRATRSRVPLRAGISGSEDPLSSTSAPHSGASSQYGVPHAHSCRLRRRPGRGDTVDGLRPSPGCRDLPGERRPVHASPDTDVPSEPHGVGRKSFNLTFKLNGHEVFSQDSGSEQLRAMTEVIDEGRLHSGQNILTAELWGPGGQSVPPAPASAAITVSDVSCLYSVSI